MAECAYPIIAGQCFISYETLPNRYVCMLAILKRGYVPRRKEPSFAFRVCPKEEWRLSRRRGCFFFFFGLLFRFGAGAVLLEMGSILKASVKGMDGVGLGMGRGCSSLMAMPIACQTLAACDGRHDHANSANPSDNFVLHALRGYFPKVLLYHSEDVRPRTLRRLLGGLELLGQFDIWS